jgi:acylpyruvate hydrolase
MKIICIGRNYAAHAAELNNPIPETPLIFLKPDTAVLKDGNPFYHPEFSTDIHHEIELVLRICKPGKHIAKEFASKYYDQITVGIDLTARDLQSELKKQGHPWEIAKAFDNSAVLGSFIPLSEAYNAEGLLEFRLLKNGEKVQQGLSNQMITTIDALISYVSQFFTLQIGDLIFTGTPEGVSKINRGDLLEGYLGTQKLLSCEVK